jgi:hypothetical protein
VSPIRFLDDLALSIRFSWPVHLAHPGLVSPADVRAAVERIRARCACDTAAADVRGTCIFLAQTRHDRTLIKDGGFFSDAEAVERVGHALGGRRLILKPHPLAPANPLLGLLQQRFGAATTDANIYALLAAARDVRFLTISSSAAIEARHFGHTPEVFHVCAHADAAPCAGLRSHRVLAFWRAALASIVPGKAQATVCSSLWAHRSSAFWRAALAPVLPLKAGVNYEERATPNRLRQSLGAWGWPPPTRPPPSAAAAAPQEDPKEVAPPESLG